MKNRKITILIPILLLLFLSCNGQVQNQHQHKVDLKELLIKFLLSKKEAYKYNEKSILFLTDLSLNHGENLFKEEEDNVGLQVGVYSFGLLGPHYDNHLMLLSSEITLIEDYKIESILLKLSDFFKHNPKAFSENQKIQVTKNVLKILTTKKINEELDKDTIDIDLNE